MSVGTYSQFMDINNPLSIPVHDFLENAYDVNGNLLTVIYKNGGPSGRVVCTLTMTYDGSGNLLTLTRA
jgi:hypothetical protein